MLHDDDLFAALRMAGTQAPRGSHRPGGGTDLHIGVASLGADAEMVAHHEAAHMELNYVTGFGLVLRAVGSHLLAGAEDGCSEKQLVELVELCRNTHEIFATTTGVWRSQASFDGALTAYPTYQQFLKAGRTLAGNLREGSFAAHTAVMCACWAAMQPPIGEVLAVFSLPEVTADRLPAAWWPDNRIDILLRAGIDPATVDVALPKRWRDEELRNAELDVSRLHETFVAVASAYYHAFAEVLVAEGSPTYAFDGHKSDPALQQWLEANPAPLGDVIHFRPGVEGNDRFWPVTLSDGERIVLHVDRELIAVHFGDLPAEGGLRSAGRDSFVTGDLDQSSVLVIVRPVRTLLKQYRVGEESATLLRAAATDGIVTAVRADVELESGQTVTLLAVLSTRAQLRVLATMPSRYGVLASVSETCSWFPNWSRYWLPELKTSTHSVRAADFPRRLWLDGLKAEAAPVRIQPFSIGSDPDLASLAGLVVWFSESRDANDPPFLILGSRRTVSALSSAVATLFGPSALRSDHVPEWEKTSMVVQRLISGEPWLDARALEDLPDFAKIGERYQQAARAAQR